MFSFIVGKSDRTVLEKWYSQVKIHGIHNDCLQSLLFCRRFNDCWLKFESKKKKKPTKHTIHIAIILLTIEPKKATKMLEISPLKKKITKKMERGKTCAEIFFSVLNKTHSLSLFYIFCPIKRGRERERF